MSSKSNKKVKSQNEKKENNVKKNEWTFFIQGGLLILIAFLVYVPAIKSGFIWDDDTFLTENPLIKSNTGLYDFWFSTKAPDYFPLVSTSLWIEWRLWGMSAIGYHLVNVTLHAMSAVLTWQVLKRLMIPGAWLAALIFAVHPVNVESVAWITERKNTLPMVFYLLTILTFLEYETASRQLKQRWYALSLIMFLLALLGKTSVVTLPFVLLLTAWWKRGKVTLTDVVHTIPFFILSFALGLVTVWFQYNRAIGASIVRDDSLLSRLAIAGWAVWFYFFKSLIPYNLTFVYPRWEINEYSIISYLPVVALGLVLMVFWRYRHTWGRPLLTGVGYFVVTLLPVLGFLNIFFMKYSLVADHWQYFSIIGIIALTVGCGTVYTGISTQVKSAFAFIIVMTLSLLTWNQCLIYQNEEVLWRDTIRKNPSAWMAYNNLGNIMSKRGQLDEAVSYYVETLKLNPSNADADYNLGLALAKQGKPDKAIEHYSAALKIDPQSPVYHNNLGNALVDLKRYDEARTHYSEALKVKPDYADAHYNMGNALAGQERYNDAIPYYIEAIKIKPDYIEAHNNLGGAYARLKQWDAALKKWNDTLALNPNHEIARQNRDAVMKMLGRL